MGFFDFLKRKELDTINELELELEKYKDIRDLNKEIHTKQTALQSVINEHQSKINNLLQSINDLSEYDDVKEKISSKQKKFEEDLKEKENQLAQLNKTYDDLKTQYSTSREIYDKLKQTISLYENTLDTMEYGIYEPVYDFDKSDDYRIEQNKIREEQKSMVKLGTAATCSVNWTIDGSVSKGKTSTNRLIRLVLRAFNGECDALVSKVKWNNIKQIEQRIFKSYESINKLGESNAISINKTYLNLKLNELRLEYEYHVKRQQEKEELRAMQEEIREEEKAKREFERAQREAEKEEAIYQKALEKIKLEFDIADEDTKSKLQEQISKLEAEVEAARLKKERALSMAQQTKRGHVYIISNIGSFGTDVYKIGMTRRLEPKDRVRELGDASVPFQFDVHAMIYSDEARTLEYELHKAFADKRINMFNHRREFFKVSLEEIEDKIKELGFEAEFTLNAEAMEYRETLQLIKNVKDEDLKSISINNKFPSYLS